MKERFKEAVAAIVYDKDSDKVLVGKKKADSDSFLKGQYHLPGETKELDESDEEALKRGMKEEANIEIKVLCYLGSHRTPRHTKVKWYECEPLNCEISFGSDLTEVLWVTKEKVIPMCSPQAVVLWPKKVKKYFTQFDKKS